MFSYYAFLAYGLVGIAAVLSGADAVIRLRGARRPITTAVLVLAVALLLSILTLVVSGLILLIAALAVLLLVALVIEIATDGAGRRRVLTIFAAAATVLTILALWPIVGITLG